MVLQEKELIKYLQSLGLEVHTATKVRGHQGFYLRNRIDISKNISFFYFESLLVISLLVNLLCGLF